MDGPPSLLRPRSEKISPPVLAEKLQNGRADSGLMDDMEVGGDLNAKRSKKRLEHGHDPRPGSIFLWGREQACQWAELIPSWRH